MEKGNKDDGVFVVSYFPFLVPPKPVAVHNNSNFDATKQEWRSGTFRKQGLATALLSPSMEFASQSGKICAKQQMLCTRQAIQPTCIYFSFIFLQPVVIIKIIFAAATDW